MTKELWMNVLFKLTSILAALVVTVELENP